MLATAARADVLALYGFDNNSPASTDADANSGAGDMAVAGGAYITTVGVPPPGIGYLCGFSAGSPCGTASFSLVPAAGYELDLQSLTFRVDDHRTNGLTYTGSGCVSLATSLDGYATSVGSGCWSIAAPGVFPTLTINLSGAQFQHLNAQNLPGGSLGLRLTGTSNGGTPGNCECSAFGLIIDNVTVNGVAAADADGDGVTDALDNCTLAFNPTQLDADGDGYGNACDADLNNSGLVTATDFNLLRSVLNLNAASGPLPAAADLNGSGLVTAVDFNLLRARLNSAPGPSGLH